MPVPSEELDSLPRSFCLREKKYIVFLSPMISGSPLTNKICARQSPRTRQLRPGLQLRERKEAAYVSQRNQRPVEQHHHPEEHEERAERRQADLCPCEWCIGESCEGWEVMRDVEIEMRRECQLVSRAGGLGAGVDDS